MEGDLTLHEEDEEEDTDDDDEDDVEEELLLLSRISNITVTKQSSSRANAAIAAQSKAQKLQEQAKTEKQQQQLRNKSERTKKQNKTKSAKRFDFTLKSIQAADSHHVVSEPAAVVNSGTSAADLFSDIKDLDVKKLLKQGYEFAQKKEHQKAIQVLKVALDKTKTDSQVGGEGSAAAALSTLALLGNEYLSVEFTRESIECFHQALTLAKQVNVSDEQRCSLIVALQNAYNNVGDKESAEEVARMYGAPFLNKPIVASEKAGAVSNTPSLSPELQKALDGALEQAIVKKDMDALKFLLAMYEKTNLKTAIVLRKHPTTGVTALHVCAGRDDVETMKQVILMGANMNERDLFGSTPLVWAARFGGSHALKELLDSGACFDDTLTESEVASWPAHIKELVGSLVRV